MIAIIAVLLALIIIWFVTIGIGNLSTPSSRSVIDPETINILQPKQSACQIKQKSQHQINIEKATAYHLDNNNPFPGLDDMDAYLIGAKVADWQVKHDRLGEKDYQGEIYWDGQS